MSKDTKYVVYWQDHINLAVLQVCGSMNTAKIAKSIFDDTSPYGCDIQEFDSFMDFLKKIRRSRIENWKDFSPSPVEVRKMKVDDVLVLIANYMLKEKSEILDMLIDPDKYSIEELKSIES